MDLSEIKNKIQASSLLSESEKKEWIFLLPKMSEEQQQELIRILSIKMAPPQKPVPQVQKPIVQKPVPPPVLKIEATVPKVFPSVIDHTSQATPPIRRDADRSFEVAKNTNPVEKVSIAAVPGLTIQDMRQARSLYEFFDSLAAKWVVAVKNRQKSPEEIMQTFESSELYHSYVEAGKQMLEGRDPVKITKSEFEAIADFRSSLKKILYK